MNKSTKELCHADDIIIFGVDWEIGLMGGISDGSTHYDMPVIKKEIKPARYVLDLNSKGKKQYYKSGSKKGEVKMKLKTPAKHKTELDLHAINDLFKIADTIVFESPAMSRGNSAASSATTNINYGKLLAVAELYGSNIVTVVPHKWKSDLRLSKSKLESIEMAEKLTGKSFRTNRGRLIDGPAEAFLIRHWYMQLKDK